MAFSRSRLAETKTFMNINFKELAEAFIRLEEELELHSLRIDGYPAWEGCRVTTFHQLLHRLGVTGQMHPDVAGIKRKSWTGRKLERLTLLTQDFWRAGSADAVFLCHGRRKLQTDGRWKDVYSDDFAAVFGGNSVSLECSYPGGHRRPAHTNRLYYLDNMEWLVSVCRRFRQYTLHAEDKARLAEIEARFNARFGIETNMAARIENHLIVRHHKKPLYRWLLKRINPKAIFICVAYGHEILIEVCKELGIVVCELQHGTIEKYQMGYYYPETPKPLDVSPDYLLTFGDYWSNLPHILPGTKKISIGFPYLDRESASVADVQKKDQILFISQGAVGQKLSEMAAELAQSPASRSKIIYKLHPNERSGWKEKYTCLLEAGVEVIDGDNPSLYHLLAESRKVVGVYSTAVFEALRFGCAVYIADLPGWEYMETLINSGAAVKVRRISEVEQSAGVLQTPSDYFFAAGWQGKFKSFADGL